jgi:hypothetical protein
VQQGNIIFSHENDSLFILLTIVLKTADQCAHSKKVSIFCEDLCFFCGRCVKSMHTDPSYQWIFCLPVPPKSPSWFGIILDKRVEGHCQDDFCWQAVGTGGR